MSAISSDGNVVYSDDALFGCIERLQYQHAPFGNVLDAGTGQHSLRWIATLKTKGLTSFTAVTADAVMQRKVQEEAKKLDLKTSNVVIGNWFGPSPLHLSEQFNVILADYLIGAMDGFSPYQQDLMLPKLVSYLKPGGRLYIVGLEPIPDSAEGDANVICKVRQVRDACILLAGHRCYREYPVDWIHRQVQKLEDVKLVETSRFPILYRHLTIMKQINVARSKFPYFASKGLAQEMGKVMDDLERQSKEATERSPTGALTLGFDYVVAVEKEW